MRPTVPCIVFSGLIGTFAVSAFGETLYSNLSANNELAAATRQGLPGIFEIETADDFVLTARKLVTSATFVGVVVPGAGGAPSISQVSAEIYRVFPRDSNAARTPTVPTRTNSPSDVAFASRDSGAAELSFSTTVVSPNFSVLNSVQPGAIHPMPGQTTGGNGPLLGTEIEITASFASPFDLAADHYFFVPQVTLTDGAQFFWLPAARPLGGVGTTPFTPDLQAWTRDANLDPDWLRIGTDIIGGTSPPTFNMAFSLDGTAVPLPGSGALMLGGLALVACVVSRRMRVDGAFRIAGAVDLR